MIASLAMLFIPPPALVAPVLPPGCSQEFQRIVVSVEQSLKRGEFELAAKKVQLLPKASCFYSWSDANVPQGSREALVAARDAAIQAWNYQLRDVFALKPGEPADIKFGFEAKLANAPGTNSPMGLARFVSETNLPRLESVIGLSRGADGRASGAVEVQNDVAYSIGTYLGVADDPIPTTAMSREDGVVVLPNVVTASERSIAKRNLAAVEVLRDAIHRHVPLEPAQPKASFDSVSLSTGPVLQGQLASAPIMITNIGQAPLSYYVMPTCSCITTGPAGELKPNEAKLVEVTVDTIQWTRTGVKKLVVMTNDPDTPIQVVPIEVKVNPRYRWIVPGGGARLVGDSGADIDLYLDIPFGSEMYVKDVRFAGVLANEPQVQPWEGDMADPDNDEGVKHRTGYHVKLHVKGDIEGGRQVGTLTLVTTSQQFPEINYNFSFQKGIVAMPDEISMGLVSATPKPFYSLLTRPHKAFRVLAADSSSKLVKATFSKVAGTDDYRIEVKVVGKLPHGDYLAIVHVYTDDPRQAKIDIPVRGTVE